MTRSEILAMPAGRELDVLVAVHVVKDYTPDRLDGLLALAIDGRLDDFVGEKTGERYPIGPLKYSTDIAAAWAVVEKVAACEYVKVHCQVSHYHGDYCSIVAPDPLQLANDGIVKSDAINIWGETMPLAICRAALLAVMPCT